MEFISLRAIIYDLLDIIRAAQIADDEPITEKQVESWIHQYRGILIKRDVDKNKTINPDYIQSIDSIPLEYDSTRKMYKTSISIPVTIDFNHKTGLLFIGDVNGNRVQLLPESRVNYQKYNKYTGDDTVGFLKNRVLYLSNSKELDEISIRGIFYIPGEAEIAAGNTYTYDSFYPIPYHLVPTLKQEILKNELGIEYSAPNDNTNDSNHNISSDVEGVRQTYTTRKPV